MSMPKNKQKVYSQQEQVKLTDNRSISFDDGGTYDTPVDHHHDEGGGGREDEVKNPNQHRYHHHHPQEEARNSNSTNEEGNLYRNLHIHRRHEQDETEIGTESSCNNNNNKNNNNPIKMSLIFSVIINLALIASLIAVVVTTTNKNSSTTRTTLPKPILKKFAVGPWYNKCAIFENFPHDHDNDNNGNYYEGRKGNKQGENVVALLCETYWNGSEIINLGKSGGTNRYALDVAVGGDHICAVTNDGALFCWGSNERGQLGVGRVSNTLDERYYTPLMVNLGAGQSAKKIAVSSSHSCVITNNNEVLCWGGENYLSFPTKVHGIGSTEEEYAVEISLGRSFSCVITNKGTLKCWGDNSYGQLGVGEGMIFFLGTPTEIDVGIAYDKNTKSNIQLYATKLAIGESHACVITNVNTLSCWGENGNGQVGDGTNTTQWIPTLINIGSSTNTTNEYIENVALGGQHTCVTTRSFDNQKIFCWGSNSNSQVGDGTTTDRYSPTLIETRSNESVESLALGGDTSYAVTATTHSFLAWGLVYYESQSKPTLIDMSFHLTGGQMK